MVRSGPPNFRKAVKLRPTRAYPSNWKEVSKEFKETSPIKACVKCGHKGSKENPLQTDHIIENAKSGSHTHANFRLLCKRCNNGRNKIGKPARIGR